MMQGEIRSITLSVLEEHGGTEYATLEQQADLISGALYVILEARETRKDAVQLIVRFNSELFERELSTAKTSIVRCHHRMNGRQIPCPPLCPRQSWPKRKFRLTLMGHWKLRKHHA